MALRNSKVILCKGIKLEKDYKDVLTYSESDMVTLCQNNAIATFNTCSFIRKEPNSLYLEVSYNNALKCNYLAFQNPDYSNKWFFAFIDSIEYVGNKNTKINFTVDEFATWFDYWQPQTCFVEREHTNDDTPGTNLIPEGLELGEYIQNGHKDLVGFSPDSMLFGICSTYSPDGTVHNAVNVGGVPSAGNIYFCTLDSIAYNVERYASAGRLDKIDSVFAVPTELVDVTNNCTQHGTDIDKIYWEYKGTRTPNSKAVTVTGRPASLDGYTPKNGKLLTAPFCCMVLSNNAGSSNILGYEYFSFPNAPVFVTIGSPSIGTSQLSYPMDYKGQHRNYLEGIACGKYPTLSWSGDAYTNWLTQNAVNIGMGIINSAVKIGSAVATAGTTEAGSLGLGSSGVNSVASLLSEVYQRKIAPETSRGNINNGNVITGQGLNSVWVYQMTITAQYAARIDDFFTRFGYKTNKLKVPNQTGRTYWNFVKIAEGENIGYSTSSDAYSVPANSMEIINSIYRRGVTLWHNHDNLGNYSLSNTIVS